MAIELETIELTPEQEELVNNDLYPIDADGTTPFLDVNLFTGDEYKPLRYYLLEMNWCHDLYDLIERRESTITDLMNLGVFNEEKANNFRRLVDVAARCYHIEV